MNFKVSSVVLILAIAPLTLPATTIYTATLLGSNEVPSTGSTATGQATVTLNGDLLTVDESFTGLIGGVASAAHIHCCAPIGVNAIVAVPFTGFPATTSGTYTNTFDLTLLATYSGAFVTANGGTAASAEAALIAGLNNFQAYVNIHDATFPGGEIRGQLVPEPTTTGLLLLGLTSMFAMARRAAKRR
jgi:CHRD domain/PEP-CTERM motif